jgi:outer membrane protein assembly factor BamB
MSTSQTTLVFSNDSVPPTACSKLRVARNNVIVVALIVVMTAVLIAAFAGRASAQGDETPPSCQAGYHRTPILGPKGATIGWRCVKNAPEPTATPAPTASAAAPVGEAPTPCPAGYHRPTIFGPKGAPIEDVPVPCVKNAPEPTATWSPSSSKLSGVLTNNSDNARTGVYQEPTLTPNNVRVNTFGKLHTWVVDGQIYAQPLYVRDLTLADGKARNVVYVATERNSVYAFDAGDFHQIWSVNLGPAFPYEQLLCDKKNLYPWIGITSTPAIDPATATIYVVAARQQSGHKVYQLHALDLSTGAEKFAGPTTIGGQVNGNGKGSTSFVTLTFNPDIQLNRPGLLVQHGIVYVAFGSHCDAGDDYHGWVMAYDTTTLKQVGIYNDTPNGEHGGIWQAGRGLVSDAAGNVYLMTGNGTVNESDAFDRGESFVRLDPFLGQLDFYSPEDYDCLNNAVGILGQQSDLDLGASGPLLITAASGNPAESRLLGGGKDGVMFLLNAMNLGHYNAPLSRIVATAKPHWAGIDCHAYLYTAGTDTHHIHSGPVLWDRSPQGGPVMIYNWGENDHLKAFQIVNNAAIVGPVAQSKMIAPSGMPGGTLSLSVANRTTGIIFATVPLDGDAVEHIVTGMLAVFDATPNQGDIRLLWHSEMNKARDTVGLYAKFCPPTVADGRVYVAGFGNPIYRDDHTRSGFVHVYGLLP